MGLDMFCAVRKLFCAGALLAFSACATTNIPNPGPSPKPYPEQPSVPIEITTAPPAVPEPTIPSPPPVITPYPTPAPIPSPISVPAPPSSASFGALAHWQNTDPTPALKAFRRTCAVWKSRPNEQFINSAHPKYGRYKDWRSPCQAALSIEPTRNSAFRFFQTHFEPVNIGADTGLLTAYYAPELPVRRLASLEFSEPILAVPVDKRKQSLARQDISVTTSKVLAYGRPIDVFFLHVQGSGQIRFPDGTIYRAAFAAHNGHAYTSIGRVLIKRGELSKDQAGKRDIERWMANAGYVKTKQLMAENARYIFFKTEHIVEGQGPKGGMGIPLTDMGSLAVDTKQFPYGAVIWVEGKFPSVGGDYIGVDVGHLLIAQDKGGAIKGEKRGDVYFGSGDAAGEKAGVMKHRATWTLFLPIALAMKILPSS